MKFRTEHIDRANDGHGWYLPAIEQGGFCFGILTITAGSTGLCGDDSGHGGESFWTEVIVENFYFADDKKKEAADPNDPFPGGEPVDPADYPF